MKRCVTLMAAAALALGSSAPAGAVDYPFAGKLFIAKTGGKLVKVLSKGAFTMPAPGSEPTAVGATLEVFDVGGAAGDDTYNLPAAGWTGDAVKGFKYKGAAPRPTRAKSSRSSPRSSRRFVRTKARAV